MRGEGGRCGNGRHGGRKGLGIRDDFFQGEVVDGDPTGVIIFVEIQILRHAKARKEGPNLNLGRRIKIEGGKTFRSEKPKTGAERPNTMEQLMKVCEWCNTRDT